MKHLKSLNYCKRMIKSTSAFGNASKGFASNEVAQLVTRYERFLRIAGQVICKHTIPRDSLRSWRVTNSNP